MRKRTARKLRRIADRLDPKPARWYQAGSHTPAGAMQQSATITYTMSAPAPKPKPKHGHRVLADYLTSMDLKKLRP